MTTPISNFKICVVAPVETRLIASLHNGKIGIYPPPAPASGGYLTGKINYELKITNYELTINH
jgi:hypothetical protein